MANEVVNNQEMPDWMRARQAEVPQDDVEALSGLSNKIPRISLRGRKFRLIVDGEEIKKPADTLDVVILGVSPEKGRMVKTYYAKGYTSGDSTPPDCSSADGVVPDSWIQNKQHTNCAGCPKNAFGSATSQKGKPAKACKDSKRLDVVIPESDPELKLGVDGVVFSLGVPVTSLASLGEYGKFVSKNGYPLSGIVTRLELEDTEFPQILFNFGSFLDQQRGTIAMERNVAKDWLIGTNRAPQLENSGAADKPAMISQTKTTPPPPAQSAQPETAGAVAGSGKVDDVVGSWGDEG